MWFGDEREKQYFFYIFTMQVWSSDEILDSLAQTGGETLNNSIPVKTKRQLTVSRMDAQQNQQKQMDNENTDYENHT